MENGRTRREGFAYKILLFAPITMFFMGVISLIVASILEMPTHRGVVYGFFAMMFLLMFFFSVFPGIIMSIIGTILAAKAKRKGFTVMGIIEILLGIGGIYLIWYMIFVAGASV